MMAEACTCTIRNHGRVIEFCPMHKAAPDWRTALERIIVIGEEAATTHGGYRPLLNRTAEIAVEAIAQARRQS